MRIKGYMFADYLPSKENDTQLRFEFSDPLEAVSFMYELKKIIRKTPIYLGIDTQKKNDKSNPTYQGKNKEILDKSIQKKGKKSDE